MKSMSRRVIRGLAYSLLTLVAIPACLVFVSGREGTLRWLLDIAAAHIEPLTVEDVHGALSGRMRIGHLSWEDAMRRVEVTDLRLDWQPSDLLHGRVLISTLQVAHLEVETRAADSSAPMRLPDEIALPLAFSVSRLEIAELLLRNAEREDSIRDIGAALDLDLASFNLRITRSLTELGPLEVQVSAHTRTPFAVSGELQFEGDESLTGCAASARIGGTLLRTSLKASANCGEASAEISALLAPTSGQPLIEARLDAKGINPAHYSQALPASVLDARFEIRNAPGNTYHGTAAIRNQRPGRIDQQLLPLEAVSFTFDGDFATATLREVRLNLGAGGTLEGTGQVAQQRLDLALDTTNLNLRGIQQNLHSTSAVGSVKLGITEEAQELVADLAQTGLAMKIDARLSGGELNLHKLRLEAGEGRLSAHGGMELAEPRHFSAQGVLSRIDLAEFGEFPVSVISGTFRVEGELAPVPVANLQVDVRDSSFKGYPLVAEVRASLTPDRMSNAVAHLLVAENRLDLEGSYGRASDQMSLRLKAPHLARLGPGFGGQLEAHIALQGESSEPSVEFSATGADITLPGDHAARTVKAEGHMTRGVAGELSLKVSARDLRTARWSLGHLAMDAAGTRDNHTLNLSLGARGLDARLTAKGAWDGHRGWDGQLTRFEQRTSIPVRMEGPAVLRIAAQGFSLAQLHLRAGETRLAIATLERSPEHVNLSGEIKGVTADLLQPWVTLPPALRSTLSLDGQWALEKDTGSPWHGHFTLSRQSGDMELTGATPVSFDLTRLAINGRIQQGTVETTINFKSALLGTLEAAMRLPMGTGELPSISRSAPLTGSLKLDLPSLEWIPKVAGSTFDLAGSVRARITAAGTLDVPQLGGTLRASGLMLRSVEEGVNLREGELAAKLSGSTVHLAHFGIRAGQGDLTASGRMGLIDAAPEMTLEWKAAQLEAIRRPDRHLVLSGAGRITLKDRQVALGGKLAADEGLIELEELTGITKSEDVLVAGRAEADEAVAPLLTRTDLAFDFGKRFFLKGLGLDARLEGEVRVQTDADRLPRAYGRITISEGSYSAYGQRLKVERGLMTFLGTIDNPGLDLLALRKNQSVEAGVAVTGTATSPAVKLVSWPEVPDSAKLSWLVLGRGPDTANGADMALLSTAASALLAGGESATLQGKLEKLTGLDEVGFRSGSTVSGSVMTLGKRLSADTYLVYERGLAAAASAVKLRHMLTPSLSVQTEAGTRTAVDLFYNIFFD